MAAALIAPQEALEPPSLRAPADQFPKSDEVVRVTRKFFGTDGIRDRAGAGLLSPELIEIYGRAIGHWLRARLGRGRILIGRDPRASGPEILMQLASGLTKCGHTVVDGGILSTPAVQLLCLEDRFELAVVISASHNPAHDNGIKLFGPNGRKLADEAELELEAEILRLQEGGSFVLDPRPGPLLTQDLMAERYCDGIAAHFADLDLKGVKIVLDCAHGAASAFGPALLERFGAEIIARGVSPDGHNINDGAGVFAMEELAKAVLEAGAAVGIALDGDADRVLMVDAKGCLRDGDHLIGLLAEDLGRRGQLPGRKVVGTVMANLGLKSFLAAQEIELAEVPVGDRHVAERMAQSGAALGGEQSGHVIFHEGGRWRGDGLYTSLRVLDAMVRSQKSLAELCQVIEKYPQVLINVKVQRKLPFEEFEAIKAARDRALSDMGGDGRILLRYSGTEPLLRVMVEGRDLPNVQRLAESIAEAALGCLG